MQEPSGLVGGERRVSAKETIRFVSLPGWTSYEDARQLQRELVEKRIRDEVEDTILLLEHLPVVTQGRGLQRLPGKSSVVRHMPLPDFSKLDLVVEGHRLSFSESERGGDLTYHGPGQLVIYPIFKLDGSHLLSPHHSIEGFLRGMERVIIDLLRTYGLEGESREGATGVWVGAQKIASIGIAVRRWVTYHGIALNGINDLRPFHLFSPCGFHPEVMTRLSDCVPHFKNQTTWREDLEKRFSNVILGSLCAPQKILENPSSRNVPPAQISSFSSR